MPANGSVRPLMPARTGSSTSTASAAAAGGHQPAAGGRSSERVGAAGAGKSSNNVKEQQQQYTGSNISNGSSRGSAGNGSTSPVSLVHPPPAAIPASTLHRLGHPSAASASASASGANGAGNNNANSTPPPSSSTSILSSILDQTGAANLPLPIEILRSLQIELQDVQEKTNARAQALAFTKQTLDNLRLPTPTAGSRKKGEY